jgi:hypothetical protein
MLDKVVESRDIDEYDYTAGNINEYGTLKYFIGRSWIFVTNWNDYFVRGSIFALLFILSGGNIYG